MYDLWPPILDPYLAIFVPDHRVVPRQHLAVKDAVVRGRSSSGNRAANFDRLEQGDVSLLEGVGVRLAGEDHYAGHSVPVRLAARIYLKQKLSSVFTNYTEWQHKETDDDQSMS